MPITRAYGQASQLGNTPAASNPVINGAFDIWQRGTSLTTTAIDADYTADRWYSFTYGATSGRTISRQTTGDTTNLPNIRYCARIQRDSGNTSTLAWLFFNPFETDNSVPFAGKTITLSFYARRGANFSSASNNLLVVVSTGTGTDQNPINGYTGGTDILAQNVTLTTTWQRFSLTATVGSNVTEMMTNFIWTPSGTAGAADYYEITGVQIDIGSVALPFRRNGGNIAGELQAAQRYYQRFTEDVAYTAVLLGMANSTTTCVLSAPLLTAMRTSPTFSAANVYLYSQNNIKTVSSYTNRSSKTNVSVIANTSGLTGGEANRLEGQGSSNGYVEMSAEL